MQKPVWRMNTGKGVPGDLGSSILYMDGFLVERHRDCSDYDDPDLWKITGRDYNIAAYETTCTRTAKRGAK